MRRSWILALPLLSLPIVASEMQLEVRSDISEILQSRSVHNPLVFSAAMRIVQTLQTLPTCNHVAALTLINSCRSLDFDAKKHPEVSANTELVLDEIKSEYAARLAICELTGARAALPNQCADFVPSEKACAKSRFSRILHFLPKDKSAVEVCYSSVSEKQVKACLKALESKPQWWTSYSNARQNAVVMCQASRDAIEKDNQIATLKSMTEVTSEITGALDRSLKDAQSILHEQKKQADQLVEEYKAMRSAMLQDHQAAYDTVLRSLSNIEHGAQSIWGSFGENVSAIRGQFRHLSMDIKQAVSNIDEGKRNVLALITDAHEITSGYIENQNQHWQESFQQAKSLHDSLLHTKDHAVSDLDQAITGMESRTKKSQEELTTLDEKILSMSSTLDTAHHKSVEMFSVLFSIYEIFSHGRNALNIVLVLLLIANKQTLRLALNGWAGRCICATILVWTNRNTIEDIMHRVASKYSEPEIAVCSVFVIITLSYIVYRIAYSQAIYEKDGLVLPRIEVAV